MICLLEIVVVAPFPTVDIGGGNLYVSDVPSDAARNIVYMTIGNQTGFSCVGYSAINDTLYCEISGPVPIPALQPVYLTGWRSSIFNGTLPNSLEFISWPSAPAARPPPPAAKPVAAPRIAAPTDSGVRGLQAGEIAGIVVVATVIRSYCCASPYFRSGRVPDTFCRACCLGDCRPFFWFLFLEFS